MVSQSSRAVDLIRLSALVRWRPVLFPFEQSELFAILPERGYVVSESVLNRRPPYGGRLEVSGIVAHKGTLALVLDTERPGMGLEGKNAEELLQEFDDIEQYIDHNLRFDSQNHSRFYEIDVQALIASDGMTLDHMRQWGESSPLYGQIENTLGHPVSQYGFRICSPTATPGDEDWYDLTFEASLRSAYAYFAFLTFRNPMRSAVWDVAGRVVEIFQEIADMMEHG